MMVVVVMVIIFLALMELIETCREVWALKVPSSHGEPGYLLGSSFISMSSSFQNHPCWNNFLISTCLSSFHWHTIWSDIQFNYFFYKMKEWDFSLPQRWGCHPWRLGGIAPLSHAHGKFWIPSFLATFTGLVKNSRTKVKSKWDIEFPCLNPSPPSN